jgi:hypothetical protein
MTNVKLPKRCTLVRFLLRPLAGTAVLKPDLWLDCILSCTGEGSLKAKNTRRDPRVSLSIVDFHDPYREAKLRGHVVERRPDGDFKYMDAISHKYTGKPFPFRSPRGEWRSWSKSRRRDTPSSLLNIRRPK